jgi:HAE1 family hydrophobic/amphiphilic exporter-1
MGLTRLAVYRPVLLITVLVAILVLGWRARSEMPAEMDPRVEIPIINVMTLYPGAGPEEVERQITRPVEDAVGAVANVTSVESRSLEAASFVTVHLKLGTDINAAAADIRAKLDALKSSLPEDVESPQVAKLDYNARPVLVLGVTSSGSLADLRTLVDEQIKPRLAQVPGLGSVAVVGGLRKEIQIQIDPDRLAHYGLNLPDLMRSLQASSMSLPAGAIQMGRLNYQVRVLGEFRTLEDIRNAPIAGGGSLAAMMDPRTGGRPQASLRLRDIATVTEGMAERDEITRVNRRESIGLILSRLSDANTVKVAEGVKAELAKLGGVLPADVKVSVLQDHSQTVSDALDDINFTLILGALLAVLVVWLFLHSLKDTLIVACSIPTSIVFTFLVMYFAGFSLNQMTMLALSLSVGILVDDSILVLECIHRHRAMGKSPFEAALDGREEIGLADATNTFVDVVVFLPIAFMGGVVGQFFWQFGLTIATATLASLYVSFTLTPMLAARWLRHGEGVGARRSGFAAWFDRRYERLETLYRRTLAWALRHRPAVAIAGFGSLAVVGLLAWTLLGFDFTPSVDRGQIAIQLEMAPGTSLEETNKLMGRAEEIAAQIPEVDRDRMLATVGEVVGGFGSLPDRGNEIGQLTLMLQDKQGYLGHLLHPFGEKGKRSRSDETVAEELRDRLKAIPGSENITVSAVRGMTTASAPVQLALYGNDLTALQETSERIADKMRQLQQLQNVDSSLRLGKPEVQIRIDRSSAEDLFLSSAEVAATLRTAVAGNTELSFRLRDQSIPIRVQIDRSGRSRPEALLDIPVGNRSGSTIYLRDVAQAQLSAGPTRILRADHMRRVLLSANVRSGVSLGDAQNAVKSVIGDVPAGVKLEWEGEVDDMQESGGLMAGALILAIVLSYLLMAALFNNFVYPLSIMGSVPMALVGALLALILTRETMNIVSMIGIVMLVGLVSKNAILLVDYTNTLRGRGLRRDDALEAAGPVRLRPILMTTFATVVGMLPVALKIGRASEMRSPMAIVVIGGLILSTLLTLLVVPVMYSYYDDMTSWLLRAWRRKFPPDHPFGGPTEPSEEPARDEAVLAETPR